MVDVRAVGGQVKAPQPQQFREEGTERQGVERAGQGLGKPAHPSGQVAEQIVHALLDPQVASARRRETAAQFGVAAADDQGNAAVQQKGQQQTGSGLAGRNPGQNEDARANHGADTNHGDGEQPQIATEGDLDLRFRLCHGRARTVVSRRERGIRLTHGVARTERPKLCRTTIRQFGLVDMGLSSGWSTPPGVWETVGTRFSVRLADRWRCPTRSRTRRSCEPSRIPTDR